MSFDIALAPMLPWSVLAPLFAVAAVLAAYAVARRARGGVWRLLVMGALTLTLLNPSLVREQREPIDDVAVIVVDRSPSQTTGDRLAVADDAVDTLGTVLADQNGLSVRVVEAGPGNGQGIDDTRLFEALNRSLSDVPRRRLAGVIMVTDGQVHDAPGEPHANGDIGPVHVLLTGERQERDRLLTIEEAPAFGLVGRSATLTVRVSDLPGDGGGGLVELTVRQDGGAEQRMQVPVGVDTQLTFPIEHGGATVFEFEVEAADEELTLANNRAAVAVSGVRDRLRVLLVSGEPHAGERTWRNLLKADPSVDLVHFTILRPPENDDGTPIGELSLIAFPIRELFDLRLYEFDLIIFDRYRRRGVLHSTYLDNIARYVLEGGAFLEASGPDFADMFSLYRTPLGGILPGEPTGQIIEEGYRARVTDLGHRHPVTAALDGAGDGDTPASWGRWFRQIDVRATGGSVLMDGVDGRPLLILDRVGEGRVAQLMTDHVWLWSRGFEGGGPQAELLRRLAHWLMREPELEENDLRAEAVGDTRISIERRSLEDAAGPVDVTTPSGQTETVMLESIEPGRAAGAMDVNEPGIFRIDDGERTALAVVGTLNPPELSDMRTSETVLAPVVEATGGDIVWLGEDGVPSIRRVRPGRDAAGSGWIGLRANGDYVVTGLDDTPLLPAGLAMMLALGTLMTAWRREGR